MYINFVGSSWMDGCREKKNGKRGRLVPQTKLHSANKKPLPFFCVYYTSIWKKMDNIFVCWGKIGGMM